MESQSIDDRHMLVGEAGAIAAAIAQPFEKLGGCP